MIWLSIYGLLISSFSNFLWSFIKIIKYIFRSRIILNLETTRIEKEDYVPYATIVSDIIDRYIDPELQESAGFVTPKEEYSSPSQILGLRDAVELLFR